MWSICKKELRQFFSSLTGYIAIIVFLLVIGLVLFVLKDNILEEGYASLDRFFSFAPWVALFLVSAITMRSFSDEFRSGTFEILQTRPLSGWQIVAGKFLGSLIVAVIALLPTIVYYFTINHLASSRGIDSGAAAGSYLGLLLLTAVFTSIGVCISSFTTNAVVSFIITLIACILFYFGFSAISQLFGNGADYFIEMIGIGFHYQSISRGVADTRDIIYFLSLILFFLLLTRQNLARVRGRKGRTIWWAGLALGLVAINFVAAKMHSRFDLTEEKRYSLTKTSRDLARNLKSDLEISVFLEGDFPSQFRKLSNATREFASNFREFNPSRIRYRFINPQEDAAAGRSWGDSITALGASPINVSVQVKAGEENKIVFPYAMVSYEGRHELVNLFPSSKRNISAAELNNAEATMEYQFARALDHIQDPEKPSVAYAIGNGEPQSAEAFSFWYTIDPESFPRQNVNPEYFDVNARSNYKLGLFNINSQRSIPDEIDVLVVVKPSARFTDEEKLKIDQYVMRGGKVLWFIDDLNAEPDSLSIKSQLIAYDRDLYLQELLFNYGARINPDLVMDLQCDFLPFAVGGSASAPQYEFLHWNYYPLFESHNNHIINKNIGLVRGKFVNSIDTIETQGIRKTFLLQSSSNSRTISTPALISPNENRNTTEDALFRKKDIPVAVLLEGRFTSFFKGRIGRAQMDSLASLGGFRDANAEENKMIVVSDGDMVLNDVSSQGPLPMGMNLFTMGTQYQYQFANRDFLLNCLEYLTSKTNIIQTRNKEIVLRLLDTKKAEAEKTRWQLINIVLPIGLIILFGLIHQQVRRYRFASK